jgi:hypothetical protein
VSFLLFHSARFPSACESDDHTVSSSKELTDAMIDTEKANICTVMNTFGFDLVSGGPAIRPVVQFFKLFDSRRPTDTNRPHIGATVRNGTAWVSSGCHHART